MNKSGPKYFSIGEVCKMLELKPYTLRYWEKKTSLVQPVRRSFDRRYYTKTCVENVSQLKVLICEMGYSIDDAVQILEDRSVTGHKYKVVIDKIQEILAE